MWWDWCYDSWHECDENEIWHQCVHSHISFSVFTRFSICTSCRPFPSLSLVECYQWFRVARIFFAKKLPRVGFRENNAKLWKVCVKSLPVPFVFPFPSCFCKKKQMLFPTRTHDTMRVIPASKRWERFCPPMRWERFMSWERFLTPMWSERFHMLMWWKWCLQLEWCLQWERFLTPMWWKGFDTNVMKRIQIFKNLLIRPEASSGTYWSVVGWTTLLIGWKFNEWRPLGI